MTRFAVGAKCGRPVHGRGARESRCAGTAKPSAATPIPPVARSAEEVPSCAIESLIGVHGLFLRDRLVEVKNACWRPWSMRPVPPAEMLLSYCDSPFVSSVRGFLRCLPEIAPVCPSRGVSAPISRTSVAGAGRRKLKGKAARAARRTPGFLQHAFGKHARSLEIGRIVQQHQRLQRRVRDGAARGALLAIGRIEGRHLRRRRRALPERVHAAAIQIRRRGSARRSAWRSRRRTPSPPTDLAADRETRSGPPTVVIQQSADGKRVVANHLRRQADSADRAPAAGSPGLSPAAPA